MTGLATIRWPHCRTAATRHQHRWSNRDLCKDRTRLTCWPRSLKGFAMSSSEKTAPPKVAKTDAEWRAQLTHEQYYVTRGHGTERPFTGPHLNEKRAGTFACVCCGAPLFDAQTKFESGTGWP